MKSVVRISALILLAALSSMPQKAGQAQPAQTPAAAPDRQQKLAGLLKDVRDSNPRLRFAAAIGLATLGPEAEPALPALLEMLKDTNENLRLNVVLPLGKIGKAAVPVLTMALKDPSGAVRRQGVRGLGDVGAPAGDAAAPLCALLH